MSRRAVVTAASEITTERIRWAWRSRMPVRALSVIAGEKGLGKSALTNAEIVARVTLGTLEGELYDTPGDVLILSAEDDWPTVIKPRLMACGADLKRVHRFDIADGDLPGLFTLPDDVPLLAAELARLRDTGHRVVMVVIDPIGSFVTEAANTHADSPVRRALAPLVRLAEDFDISVVIVAHLTKDDSKRYLQRVSGAAAFVNIARSVMVVVRDPDDPEGEQGYKRLLVHVSGNWGRYAPTRAFHLETREVDLDDATKTGTVFIVSDGDSVIGVDELQRQDADISGDDCEEAITAVLDDGEKASREVKRLVTAELGCSRRTVERAAIRLVGRGELSITEGGFPRTTTWALTVASAPVATGSGTAECRDCENGATARNLDPSRDSGDSRDTADTGVATEPDQQTLDTAEEKLAARWGPNGKPPADWKPTKRRSP